MILSAIGTALSKGLIFGKFQMNENFGLVVRAAEREGRSCSLTHILGGLSCF